MHHVEENHATDCFSHVSAAFKCLSYIPADKGGPTQQGDGKSEDFWSKDLLKGSHCYWLYLLSGILILNLKIFLYSTSGKEICYRHREVAKV